MRPFAALTWTDLRALARALKAGRLAPPFVPAEVGRYVRASARATITMELEGLAELGMGATQLAAALELLAGERREAQALEDRLDLVWSGPGIDGAGSRATASVVRELFATAQRSVLICSYALDQPERARGLFERLAARMDTEPGLEVRLLVNVARPWRSNATEAALLGKFAAMFADDLWPGERLPAVYYDPRALSDNYEQRACLHAKCVVIDDERALVTSANFTEAAHDRNIEAGVLLDDPRQASALRRRFDALIRRGVLLLLELRGHDELAD